MFFNVPYKKKSSGVMSGERAGHEIGPSRPIHRFGKISLSVAVTLRS